MNSSTPDTEEFRIAEDLYNKGLYDEAFIKYRDLAEQGVVDCQTFVGWMYHQGEGVSKSEDSAFEWYKKAAQAGSAEAQFRLAKLCAKKKNYSESLELYKKAATQDYSPALFRLGWVYETGRGVDKDNHKAFLYYERAAALGNIFGIKNTALMMIKGHSGFALRFKGIYLFIKAIAATITVGLRDPHSERLLD